MCVWLGVTVNLYQCSLALNDQLSCPALDSSVSRSAGEFEVNHPVASRSLLCGVRACVCMCARAGGSECERVFQWQGFLPLYSASLCGVLCELGRGSSGELRSESSCLSFLKIAAHVCSAMRRWEIMPTVLPLGSLVLITNSCYKLALLMWPAWKSIINSGLLISPMIILGDHTWVFSSTHTRAGDTQHSSEVK